jgi:hypothetical protein
MSALTFDYLDIEQVNIPSIISRFELLKSKIPNIFKTTKDINSFIVADQTHGAQDKTDGIIDQTDGIIDYKWILHKFQAELHIFLIHTEDHSIKELIFKITELTCNIFELVKCIELEYNEYLDRNINNILRRCEVNKNSPKDVCIIRGLLINEYARHEANMIECVNNRRIQIKKLMIYIENYIIKLNPGKRKQA